MPGMRHAARLALILGLTLAWTAAARAERIAVVAFSGKRATAAQKQVERALRAHGYKVARVARREQAPADLRIVTGRVVKAKKRWRLELQVFDPGADSPLATTTLSARQASGLPRLATRFFWKRLGAAVRAPLPAAEPEPEPEPEPEAPPEPDPVEPPTDAATPATEPAAPAAEAAAPAAGLAASRRSGWRSIDASATVMGRVFTRSLRYKDAVFEDLAEYEVPVAPAFIAAVDWYPVAALGVAASYSYTKEFESEADSAALFPTRASAFSLGARARTRALSIEWRGELDFGGQSFVISDSATREKPAIPSVTYRFVRAGAAASRVLGSRWMAGLGLGYRYLLSTGEIESDEYFPRLSAAGIDGELWLAFALSHSVQLRAGVDLERYFYTLNPEPGDARVAGGATDQFLGAYLGIGFRP